MATCQLCLFQHVLQIVCHLLSILVSNCSIWFLFILAAYMLKFIPPQPQLLSQPLKVQYRKTIQQQQARVKVHSPPTSSTAKHKIQGVFIVVQINSTYTRQHHILQWIGMKWTEVEPCLGHNDRSPVSWESTLLIRLIKFHTFNKVISFSTPPSFPFVFPTCPDHKLIFTQTSRNCRGAWACT